MSISGEKSKPIVGINSVAVLKAARRPASARRLTDFLLSRQGQAALLERGFTKILAFRLKKWNSFRVMSRLNELQNEFSQVFNPR